MKWSDMIECHGERERETEREREGGREIVMDEKKGGTRPAPRERERESEDDEARYDRERKCHSVSFDGVYLISAPS